MWKSYYYSHIFPDSRAQHCNYDTLLAGRCCNKVWYSVNFPMGPSLFSMFVVLVRVIGLLRRRCIYLSAFYLATSSILCLSLSLPRWAYLYRLELFCNCISLCPALWAPRFSSSYLGGIFCIKDFSVVPYINSAACPSYPNALRSNGGSIAEGFRLSITHFGCLSCQSWMMREYVFGIW